STGTPSIRQSANFTGTYNGGGTGLTASFPMNTLAGSMLVMVYSNRFSNLNRTPKVNSDTQANSWSTIGLVTQGGVADCAQTAMMIAQNTIGGANTINMDLPSTSNSTNVQLLEITNIGVSFSVSDSGSNPYVNELSGSDASNLARVYDTKVVTGGGSFSV